MSWQWWWWTFAPILQNLAKTSSAQGTWLCLEWIFWGTWHVCFTCPSQVGGPDCTHVTFSSKCRQHCRRSLQFRFNPALPEAQASLTETLLPIVLWVSCHVLPNFDKISSQPLDPFELIMMCYKERIVDYHCLLNISRCYRVCAKATKWWIGRQIGGEIEFNWWRAVATLSRHLAIDKN